MALFAGVLAAASAVLAASALACRRDGVVMERALASPRRGSRPMRSARRRRLVGLGALVLRAAPTNLVNAERLRRRLRLAGIDAFGVEEVAAAKVVGGAIGLVLGAAAPGPMGIAAAAAGVAAFVAPDLALARRAARRLARIDDELPQLLDVLAAASHAGLGGPLALRRSVAAIRGPLADELQGVLDAVDLGGRWRDSLRDRAEDLDLRDLRRTVVALTRTETLGTSLADAVTELASSVRESRRAARTERARKAPVKMLFPLVFLVLPSFLLLTVVPVLFSTVESIR
jgi:tight adherence protein C